MCPIFGDSMDSGQLHDLVYMEERGIVECLDRVISNNVWNFVFSNSVVTYLPQLKPDHIPLRLSLMLDCHCSRRRPFRFLAGWVKHLGFLDFVKENWGVSTNILTTHSDFTSKLSDRTMRCMVTLTPVRSN
ncbi:(+)-neomenthol dehydrogenase-like [Gossypium australe]|uniref:(+)-neomenthol dehydrogenase-like n=1 Tax=Gossypium australe TaxID=47621 RepID=A0A5B6WTU7_9ROSI|nr:(+)-neomenthol dehydrogenase-like [Gossypium australe]